MMEAEGGSVKALGSVAGVSVSSVVSLDPYGRSSPLAYMAGRRGGGVVGAHYHSC